MSNIITIYGDNPDLDFALDMGEKLGYNDCGAVQGKLYFTAPRKTKSKQSRQVKVRHYRDYPTHAGQWFLEYSL